MAIDIKIRKLTKEDNQMLVTLRELTEKGTNSQAVLAACYRLLRREEDVKELKDSVSELQRKIDAYKHNVRSMFAAQENLTDLLKD